MQRNAMERNAVEWNGKERDANAFNACSAGPPLLPRPDPPHAADRRPLGGRSTNASRGMGAGCVSARPVPTLWSV